MIQVYILECIDRATKDDLGNQCAMQFINPRAVQENVALSIADIRTKNDVLKLLDDAYQQMVAIGRPSPPIILHIDSHGNEHGFELIDEEEVFPWDELYESCARLSIVSNIQVILIVGTCHGIQATQMMKTYEVAPFFCIFGPGGPISNYDLMQFYGCFYNELMTHKRIDVFTKNVMAKFGHTIVFISSPHMFKRAYKSYMDYLKGPKQIQRQKRLLKKIKKSSMSESEKREKAKYVRDSERMARDFFEISKRRFFLLDEYPENEERFASITFDSIAADTTLPPLF